MFILFFLWFAREGRREQRWTKADISAQVEVQRTQIQILIETVTDTEKEIEKEKELIEEGKREAVSRVASTDPSLLGAISQCGVYQVCMGNKFFFFLSSNPISFSLFFPLLSSNPYDSHLFCSKGPGRNAYPSCEPKTVNFCFF